jgi:hypothetical protein
MFKYLLSNVKYMSNVLGLQGIICIRNPGRASEKDALLWFSNQSMLHAEERAFFRGLCRGSVGSGGGWLVFWVPLVHMKTDILGKP